MGAIFSRAKTWVSAEDVTFSDLNAEFDNILNNLTAANVDDFSANVTQMQSTADPGEVGTESLATSVAGEIQRLRQLIVEITGEDEWYESPTSSILGLANAIGSGLTNNRLVSGRVISGTQQPQFLTPNGAAATVNLEGATTNFIYYVDGVEYSITTDITLTGLTAAPSSNNTCLVDDAIAADQEYTRYTGENGTEIPVDNMGSEISSLVGQWAAFSHGSEYFMAYVESSTRLSKARRGFFFNSSDAAVSRDVYTNNDTITLLKLSWIFAQTDGTLTVTYNNPTWADDEPSSPSIGDFWFDISANTWKTRGASTWSSANAVLIGVCAQDTSNCVAARSFEFFKNYDNMNTCEVVYNSATEVHSKEQGSQVSVWGTVIKNEWNKHIWDITADRDSGVSETSSTQYWVYLTETGDTIISDIRPYDRRRDLKGFYHPHKSWRAVGSFFNDGSSDIEAVSVESFFSQGNRTALSTSQTTASIIEVLPKTIRLDGSGGGFSEHLPSAALFTGHELVLIRTDNTPANAVTLDPFGSETINGDTTYPLYTQYENLKMYSDGTNWIILNHYADTPWAAYPADPTSGFGTVSSALHSFKRSGDMFFGMHHWTNGTVAASSAKITLPYSLNIGTSHRNGASSTGALVVGSYGQNASNEAGYVLTASGDSTTGVYFGTSYDTSNSLTIQNGSGMSATGRLFSCEFSVSIAEWKA